MNWRHYVLAIAFIAIPKYSLASCYKPDPPSCAGQYGKFDDQNEFDSCKNDMESYKSEIEEFVSCLKRQADAVSNFNSRASQ
jgi:hypothetical protein